MNKKGFFLAEETLKIIIAVICIGFLIFILGKMYYSYTLDKTVQEAKDSLARIEKEINSMKGNEEREIVIYKPSPPGLIGAIGKDYWVLVSFDMSVPDFCNEKGWNSCLCLCKNPFGIPLIGKDLEEKCDEKDICVSFPQKRLIPFQKDLKNLPITLLVKQTVNNFGSGEIIFSI
jgi:hypothetical protein